MNIYGAISKAHPVPKLSQYTLQLAKRNFGGLATTIILRPNQGRIRSWPCSPLLASHITARNYSDKAKVDAGTKYEIWFKNSTPTSRHFAVYQKFPNTPGLRSIAWKVVGIPPSGTGSTQWTMDFGVAIVNWQTGTPGIQTEQQIVPAKLGEGYKIILSPGDGDIPMITPKPV